MRAYLPVLLSVIACANVVQVVDAQTPTPAPTPSPYPTPECSYPGGSFQDTKGTQYEWQAAFSTYQMCEQSKLVARDSQLSAYSVSEAAARQVWDLGRLLETGILVGMCVLALVIVSVAKGVLR